MWDRHSAVPQYVYVDADLVQEEKEKDRDQNDADSVSFQAAGRNDHPTPVEQLDKKLHVCILVWGLRGGSDRLRAPGPTHQAISDPSDDLSGSGW